MWQTAWCVCVLRCHTTGVLGSSGCCLHSLPSRDVERCKPGGTGTRRYVPPVPSSVQSCNMTFTCYVHQTMAKLKPLRYLVTAICDITNAVHFLCHAHKTEDIYIYTEPQLHNRTTTPFTMAKPNRLVGLGHVSALRAVCPFSPTQPISRHFLATSDCRELTRYPTCRGPYCLLAVGR